MKNICLYIILIFSSIICLAQKNRTVFDDVQYNIETVSLINSVASDISPLFIGDSLYFSAVDDKFFNKSKHVKNNTDFYNIYSAGINSRGLVSSQRRAVPGFGNDFHEGPADYCEATGELFVTVSNVNDYDRIQKMVPVENIRLELAIMKKLNGKWRLIEKLPFNDNKFHFAQPAISVTGDTLIFSSDLKPNFGSSDLFMSIRNNNQWSAPVNLGNKINTPGNELFPTFIKNNILSFASNGQTINKGGLDIYYSDFPEYTEIKSFGRPINTSSDDFGLIVHKNNSVGYFVSNRNKKSEDDIFRLDIKKLYKNFSGRIVDMNTNTPISNAALIFSMCGGGTINTVLTNADGYFINEISSNECIQVEVIAEGYESKTADISGFNNLNFKLKLNQYYEILALDAETKLPIDSVSITSNNEMNFYTSNTGNISISPPIPDTTIFTFQKDGFITQEMIPTPIENRAMTKDTVFLHKKQLNEVFFRKSVLANSDELKILQESTLIYTQVIKILKLNRDLKIELGWHSDSRGSSSDNRRQTKNRSVFAVSYLVNNGISKNRLVAKGYGESQLLNRCRNGVECSEEEHAENRRIELKIIGFVDPEQKTSQEDNQKSGDQ